MNDAEIAWEARVTEAWASIDELEPDVFVALINGLAAESPDDAIASFEMGCAFDSTGHSDLAEPLYRNALAGGLTGIRRRRAVIQLASSLRNLERPHESLRLLEDELATGEDSLSGALRGFLALVLVDLGREREAVSLALEALSEYLPRYNRSLKRYAIDLVDPS